MDSQPDDELLTRYVADEVSTDERAQVEAWLAADPARRARLKRIRRVWGNAAEAGGHPDAHWKPKREWNRFARRVGISEEQSRAEERNPRSARGPARRDRRRYQPTASPHAPQGRWTRIAGGVAASLLVLAAVAFALVQNGAFPGVEAVSHPTVYTTATGERAEVRLPDGTAVQLAPESRLAVAFASDGDQRRVRLSGRGYFEVARDTTRPFTVRAGNASVRVLGTAFDVRAYEGTSESQVVVAEGRVAMRAQANAASPSVVLEQDQRARLGTDGPIRVSAVRDVGAPLAWREGQLAFRGAPLHDVLRRLERWYDFEGRIADSGLARRPLTATLSGEASLARTLDAIALAVKGHYEYTEPNTYTFRLSARSD